MLLDEGTVNFYCGKYFIVVKVILHMFCGEAEDTFILKILLLDIIVK